MRRTSLRALALPGALAVLVVLLAAGASLLALADPVRQDIAHGLAGASAGHWLGQDEYGRDVLARIIWGARVSLTVAALSAALAAILGTLLGILGGYCRGLVELATVRVAEIVLCFPPLLLALLVVTLLGPGAGTLIFSLSILFTPGFACVAYAETLSARAHDDVTARQGRRPSRLPWPTDRPAACARATRGAWPAAGRGPHPDRAGPDGTDRRGPGRRLQPGPGRDARDRRRKRLRQDADRPRRHGPAPGCVFRTRCAFAQGRCAEAVPAPESLPGAGARRIARLRAAELP
jgi:hypothetical protein